MSKAPMFGDVVSPSVQLASRKGYTLPLSIVIHSSIAAALVIVPLMATAVLPTPYEAVTFRIVDISLPSPPPAPPSGHATPQRSVPSVNPDAAPVEPPAEIRPETGMTFGDPSGVVEDGVPDGIPGLGLAGPPEPVTPPPPPPSAPIRVGGHIKPPEKTRDVRPVYPPIAQQARVQGIVIIAATIGPTGKVTDARVLRSIPLLDQAAVEAVKQWEFTPTLLNGVPVPVVMTVTVNFVLQ